MRPSVREAIERWTRSGGSAPSAPPRVANGSLAGGVLAGAAASACCIGPLLAAALGLGSAAAQFAEFFTPLRPLFIALMLGLLGFSAHRLFYSPRSCAPGSACADAAALRRQRLLFLGAAAAAAALAAFPWYADKLFG